MNTHVNSTETHVSVTLFTEEPQVFSHSFSGFDWSYGSQGIAEASIIGVGEWYLNRIKVNIRGQGYGSDLLRVLLETLAIRKDFAQLVVEPGGYGSDPKRLVKFYERQGFVRNDERECWIWSNYLNTLHR